MYRRILQRIALCALVTVPGISLARLRSQAAEPLAPTVQATTTEEAVVSSLREYVPIDERIERKLNQITSIEMVETPLADVVEFLKDSCDVEIQLDTKLLDEVGIGSDLPVTIELRKVRLRSLLRHLLTPLELGFINEDGLIRITTKEVVEESYRVKVYPVRDLVQFTDTQGVVYEDTKELGELIRNLSLTNSWSDLGGEGKIMPFSGQLLVFQTPEVHEFIAELLKTLRTLPRIEPAAAGRGVPTAISLDQVDPQERQIRAALAKNISVKFQDQSLHDVMAAIGKQCEVNILISERELKNSGIELDKFSFALENMRLGAALDLLLAPLKLTYHVEDEVILITSKKYSPSHLSTIAYPLLDLLPLPEDVTQKEYYSILSELQSTLINEVQPPLEGSRGGLYRIEVFGPRAALVVANTSEVHFRVQSLLGQMRAAQGKQPANVKAKRKTEDEILVIGYELTYEKPERNVRGELVGPAVEHVDTEVLGEMIQTIVAPESWQANEQAYLRALPDRFLVRHEKRVHREIEILLEQLGLKFISGGREEGDSDRIPRARFLP